MKLQFLKNNNCVYWEIYLDNNFAFIVKRFKIYKVYNHFLDEYKSFFNYEVSGREIRKINFKNGSFYEVKENKPGIVPYFLMCYFSSERQ